MFCASNCIYIWLRELCFALVIWLYDLMLIINYESKHVQSTIYVHQGLHALSSIPHNTEDDLVKDLRYSSNLASVGGPR